MKRILLTLTIIGMFTASIFAQTCATPFTPGVAIFTDTCLSPPDGTYEIMVTATSDSALQIIGLNQVNVALTADIDCNALTFRIPPQPFGTGLSISGDANIIGTDVRITYVISNVPSGSLNDVCSGTYGALIIAVSPAQSAALLQVDLFPNPTTNQTTIRLTGDAKTNAAPVFRLIDLYGQLIAQGSLNTHLEAALDVSHLAHGMYQVIVENGKGQLASKVLVVQ